jgi:hypothetical protein
MTYLPDFAPFLLFFLLITFMGAWDGLARRHVRFTLQLQGIDLHIRGLPAIVIGLLCAGALFVVLGFGSNQIRLVSQACDSDWGCIAQTILVPLFFDGWGSVTVVITLLCLNLWTLSIREMQGPFQILPVAPGVVFNEGDIVHQVQERLRKAKLDPVSSDIIVRTVCEIRRRGRIVGLYKTRDLGLLLPNIAGRCCACWAAWILTHSLRGPLGSGASLFARLWTTYATLGSVGSTPISGIASEKRRQVRMLKNLRCRKPIGDVD